MSELHKLEEDKDHRYGYMAYHNQIYIEDVNYNYSVWLTKQDLLDMLELFEEQDSKND